MKKILPAIALSALFLIFGITAFVTHTTPGLRLLITLAEKVTPGDVSVGTIKGGAY